MTDADVEGRRPISAVLITLDAEQHLARVLSALRFCDEILVLDSGSRDRSIAIAREHGARVEHQDFLGSGPQKRRAVELARHDWVLSVDADEVLDQTAADAIRALSLRDPQRAWRLRRRTYIGARELRYGHWHPDEVLRLFNRQSTTFSDDAVHESVPPPTGPVHSLPGALHHYSYRDLAAIFRFDYHRLKAERYRREGRRAGAPLLCLRALLAFSRSFLLRSGWRDGAAGVVVALSASVNAVLGLAMASWEPSGAKDAADVEDAQRAATAKGEGDAASAGS